MAAEGEHRCRHCGGALAPTDARVFIGRQFGKYVITEVIGRGGMGVVLQGRHATLGHAVAVKLLRPGLGDAAFAERFVREARLLAGLRHPNIVEVYDFDIAPGGSPYYVMERLHGQTLAAELARHPQGLPWSRVLDIAHGVADALAAAHARHVVHRDLKPENIFLVREGTRERIKLLDFGIARVIDETEGAAALTQVGHVIGTPRYFAPEQFYGFPVSAATDQYALALVVAEMASGRPLREIGSRGEVPFERIDRSGSAFAACMPAQLPQATRAALERALALDPSRRFATVGDFATALGAPQASSSPSMVATVAPPLAATREAATAPTRRAPTRRRVALATGVLAALALLGLGLAWRPAAPPPAVPGTAIAPAQSVPAARITPVAAAAPWLREIGRHAVPVDASHLLTRNDEVAVLATVDGWYLHPLDGKAADSRIVLPAGRRLLGTLEGGRLAALHGSELLALDPVRGDAQTLARLPAGVDPAARIQLAPDARTLAAITGEHLRLYRIDDGTPRRVGHLGGEAGLSLLALSRDFTALASGSRLRVLRNRDGTPVLDEPLGIGAVRDLRLLDQPPRVALASVGPEVRILALDQAAPPRVLQLQGGAQALAWLPDWPTLLMVGDGGLAMWRDQALWSSSALVDEPHPEAALAAGSLLADGRGLLVLDAGAHRLLRYEYGNLPIAARHAIGNSEPWALQVEAGSHAVFVGSRDGALYRVYDGKVSRHALHADGVTALAVDGAHLASASDDRTLAIWQLPQMTVQWRMRGHDYLINQLQLVGHALWSSSSDGTLKRWRWPTLEAGEVIDVRALAGTKALSLHAFHIDAAAQHALVGTWNHRLLALARAPGADWRLAALPLESRVGYRVLDLPAIGLQLVLGVEPSRLYAWDDAAQALHALPDLGQAFYALTGDGSGTGAYAVGSGVVLHCALSRGADGLPRWQVALALASELGNLGAAGYDVERQRLWAASDDGRLLGFDTANWHLAPPRRGHARRLESP